MGGSACAWFLFAAAVDAAPGYLAQRLAEELPEPMLRTEALHGALHSPQGARTQSWLHSWALQFTTSVRSGHCWPTPTCCVRM